MPIYMVIGGVQFYKIRFKFGGKLCCVQSIVIVVQHYY